MELSDRLGMYIGSLRVCKGLQLGRLAEGICSTGHLARIEYGEREADKLTTDALLQRLGVPAGQFVRLLDGREADSWKKRDCIVKHLREGKLSAVREEVAEYRRAEAGILHRQFSDMAELNISWMEGDRGESLRGRILETLRLTQPGYGKRPLPEFLLTKNEGYLIYAYLELSEALGETDMEAKWWELVVCLRQRRYEERERVYLHPHVIWHLAQHDYEIGDDSEGCYLCGKALSELTGAKKLNGFIALLELMGKLQEKREGKTGQLSSTGKILSYLESIMEEYGGRSPLWIPLEEEGNVHILSKVIRGRRLALGMSQEEASDGICSTSTLARMEEKGSAPHRENRKKLLERVNLSGERYDYEIITEDYGDYLLRSKLGRLLNEKEWDAAAQVLEELRGHAPETKTNQQYIEWVEISLREGKPREMVDERIEDLKRVLHMTLPLDVEHIEEAPDCILSINETLILKHIASCYKEQGRLKESERLLRYIIKYMEESSFDISHYLDVYTICMQTLVSVLGDTGEYEKSDGLARESIRLLLEGQSSDLISVFLYNMAWNLEQQLERFEGEERERKRDECIHMLRQAYCAAVVSGDKKSQQHISAYFRDIYGMEMEHL